MSVVHPIPPLFSPESHTLILGSFPSVKSRKDGFFYAHPQNRFWPVIAELFGTETPKTVEEKKRLILENGLALWDVIGSCEILGSDDASIREVVPNDLSVILSVCPIERIFVNGKTAERYFVRYDAPLWGRKAIVLPSTSAANAAYDKERLLSAWRSILPN